MGTTNFKTILTIFITTILSALHVAIGFSIIKKYYSEYDQCKMLWYYELTSLISSAIYFLIGFGTLCFLPLLSETAQKRTIVSCLILLVIPIIWGSYIIYKIDDDCKNHYLSNAHDMWKLFIATYIYSCVIWGLYVLVYIAFLLNTICCNDIFKKDYDKDRKNISHTIDSSV